MMPDLREHALFTVRNLMQDNPENQAVIAQMDPVGVLSESGEVLPVPEKMRERHAQQQQKYNGHGVGGGSGDGLGQGSEV